MSIFPVVPFLQKDLFLNEDETELPYKTVDNMRFTTVVWPERKAAITLLAFINFFYSDDMKNLKIIYVNSYPDHHVLFLSKLFPKITWHLFDVRSKIFEKDKKYTDAESTMVSKNGKIVFHKGFLKFEDLNEWHGRGDVFMVSNLHSTKADQGTVEYEYRNKDDMTSQEKIYNYLMPSKALLRFKPPESGQKFDYLAGRLLFCPFSDDLSEETKLIVEQNEKITWNIDRYRKQMFWHNTAIRRNQKYENVIDDDTSAEYFHADISSSHHKYDFTYEIYVYDTYLKKIGMNSTGRKITGLVKNLSEILISND